MNLFRVTICQKPVTQKTAWFMLQRLRKWKMMI